MKLAVFSRSFYPPTRAHAWVVRRLAELYPSVQIRPRGTYVSGEFSETTPAQREEMIRAAFCDVDPRRVSFDFTDLDRPFTHPCVLYDQLLASGIEPVIVVGSGYVLNGEIGGSDIQGKWKDGKRLWNEAAFRVVSREDECRLEDLPPNTDGFVLECPIAASATIVRENYLDGNVAAAERQLQPRVAAYVRRHGLFRQIEQSI